MFVFPASATSLQENLSLAIQTNLDEHPYWLKLLHYKKHIGSTSGYKSEVISEDFFLSNTKSDPLAELKATIKSIYTPITNPNQHTRCKFIARTQWLQSKLNMELPSIECEEFKQWIDLENINQVQLVFASGYLKNPASFYGHLLLKFSSSSNKNNLLDLSINYGAMLTDTNPILYIVNGIFGGYTAGFSDSRFYRQNHNYGQTDLRDLWSYNLDLSQDQIKQIAFHLWELLDVQFTYYFLDKNCAYHFANLLALVIEAPLTDQYSPWVMPLTIFQKLMENKSKDNPLVKSVTHIASRQSQFYEKYFHLNEKQQQLLKLLLESNDWVSHSKFKSLPDNEKIALINVLFDYIEYQLAELGDSSSDRVQQLSLEKKKLIRTRFSLPASPAKKQRTHLLKTQPPHHSQYPKLIRVSGISSKESSGALLQLRPVYYDILGSESGRMPNSALSMADLTLSNFNGNFAIRRFNIVAIESYNVAKTELRGDNKYAWMINFGLDTPDNMCFNCTRVQLSGGLGKSYKLSHQHIINFMALGSIHTEHNNEGNATIGGQVSLLSKINPSWNSLITFNKTRTLTNVPTSSIKWENSFFNLKHFDVRLSLERNNSNLLVTAGYSFYF